MTDLLSLVDLEPPMGDLATRETLSPCRAIWATPIRDEGDAPPHRIIHARALQLHGPARLHRLGIRKARGYHKCGSRMDLDWVTSFRLLVWEMDQWRVHAYESHVPEPGNGETLWYDLKNVVTSGAILEVRRCGIDNWWTPWNLAAGAFVLEGELLVPCAPRNEKTHQVLGVDLRGLPEGLSAVHEFGQVRYKSPFLEVGFRLNRAGLSHLSVDEDGEGRTPRNLLKMLPGSFFQGPMLHPVGSQPLGASVLRYNVHATTEVRGNSVRYDIVFPGTGQQYHLRWTVLADRLSLHIEREGKGDLRAWQSCAWMIGISSFESTSHVIGKVVRAGESGSMEMPVWLHMPKFGSFRAESTGGQVLWRSDSDRPRNMTTSEIKLGEVLMPEGDYMLRGGKHTADIELRIDRLTLSLKKETPAPVAKAIQKCSLTSLNYRADTATLSNNGNSMHCPISMDNWSAVATRMNALLPNLAAVDLLRDSIERWLDGGPGYASGPLLQDGKIHEAEDEYLMTGSAGLLGIAEFLEHSGTREWLSRYGKPLQKKIEQMRDRDLDHDGLVESIYRTGVSGSGQWSTVWYDVISFGWKDAWTNALLYSALQKFAGILPKLGYGALAEGMDEWAQRIKTNYTPTFLNPRTGWIAGWRCKENKLHDYAFPCITGVAVTSGVLSDELARSSMEKLWAETERVGMPDPQIGVPIALWPIPDEDLADIMQGYPQGFYIGNGACSHAQTRHFVGALYQVGLTKEADYVLERLCHGFAEGLVYGACKSGVDARYWDGWPCGYEGLLTDHFGILAVALERYRQP
jgi:hypothetical protein